MSEKCYVVLREDAENIYLRYQFPEIGQVAVRKDQIASVTQRLGRIRIETTGSRVFPVLAGIRRKQRDLTQRVLGTYGVRT